MPHTPEQPDGPDARDPKEAVEGRLCAYLEGDLAGDERAQIERHLANSPQHRKLLTELADVRTWTRQLPREPAPPDLAEQFQQQVERAMLLDPAGRPGNVGRGGRWRVAAVLLLTVGGAAAVATVLLHGRPTSPAPYAVRSPATRPDPTTQRMSDEEPPAGATTAPAPTTSAVDERSATLPEPAGLGTLTGDRGSRLSDVAGDELAAAGVRPTVGDRVVELVVNAPVPAAVVDRAVDFSRDHRLAFDARPTPVTAAIDMAAGPVAKVAQQAGVREPNRLAPTNQGRATSTSTRRAGNADPSGAVANVSDNAPPVARASVGGSGPPIDARGGDNRGKETDVADRLVVIRGVTPDQFRALSAVLASDGGVVRSVDVPVTISPGEQLDVTIPQLVGPGVERTNAVRVADDGTVALPMLPAPVQAAGGTATDLERRVSERYKTANLIPAATVTVTPHGGLPATVPSLLTVVVVSRPAGPTTRG